MIYENLSNWHWSIPIGWIVYLFAVIFPVLISLWINQMIILSIIHFKVMLIAIKLETTWQRYKKTRLLANCAFISLNKRKKTKLLANHAFIIITPYQFKLYVMKEHPPQWRNDRTGAVVELWSTWLCVSPCSGITFFYLYQYSTALIVFNQIKVLKE